MIGICNETQLDLDEAIKYCQSAYQSTPSNAPYRFAILTHLADCLSTLYRRDGNLADLDQSLAYNREALRSAPHGTLTYAVVLNNVGNSSRSSLSTHTRNQHLARSRE